MEIFKADNLSFAYENDAQLFDSIQVEIPKGEITALLGRNGSGKSTLLKLLSRNIKNYSGEIKFCGNNINSFPSFSFAKSVSYLPQKTFIYDEAFTVNDLLHLGRYSYKKFTEFSYSSEDRSAVLYALKITGLESFAVRKISDLSGGERQKVLIALCLVQLNASEDLTGKALLLDEPLTFLDINHQHEIMQLLKKLNTELGLTVVIVLHDLNIAVKYCSNAIVLHGKKAALSGKPSDIVNEKMLKNYFLIDSRIIKSNNEMYINFLPVV